MNDRLRAVQSLLLDALEIEDAQERAAFLARSSGTYAFVEKSILVVTEGLGQRRFHGRVVLLANEHTASAGEMVSACTTSFPPDFPLV